MKNQLIAKYAIDPAAKGHGIYLVLWFGKKYAPSGSPDCPRKLEDRLWRTLSKSEARKISVCVMDVSGSAPVRRRFGTGTTKTS